jgi:hypothetical protein
MIRSFTTLALAAALTAAVSPAVSPHASLVAQATSMEKASMDKSSMKTMAAPLAQNLDADGLALHGYDPVAYFTQGAPAKGLPTLTATVHGATYRFASAAHRDAFTASPEKYLPAYGGYCAMGVAVGATFDIDPDAWRIVDGTLYLNKDRGTQRAWLRDVPGNIAKADMKWPEVAKKATMR